MPIDRASLETHLTEHGHVVLSQLLPRWEKQYEVHCEKFWRTTLLPLIAASTEALLVGGRFPAPDEHAEFKARPAKHPLGEDFGRQWWGLVKDGAVVDSYIFFATSWERMLHSQLIGESASLGVLASPLRRFGAEARLAIRRCLVHSPLVIGVPIPPFHSIYVFQDLEKE
jgi:hypothetical protein